MRFSEERAAELREQLRAEPPSGGAPAAPLPGASPAAQGAPTTPNVNAPPGTGKGIAGDGVHDPTQNAAPGTGLDGIDRRTFRAGHTTETKFMSRKQIEEACSFMSCTPYLFTVVAPVYPFGTTLWPSCVAMLYQSACLYWHCIQLACSNARTLTVQSAVLFDV